MRSHLKKFGSERSSAVAMIFALALVPLVLLVALTVDYAFYVQARAQASLAADAAATHAVRAADATYLYELNKDPGNSLSQDASDAISAGKYMGAAWFNAALGTMPKAYLTAAVSPNTNPTVTVLPNTDGSAGFTATVSFAGIYPPFFASLFNSLPWNINGAAQAESSYKFDEILMLLDNSSSMLIADSSSITQFEALAVCPSSKIDPNFDGGDWRDYFQHVDPSNTNPQDVTQSSIANYAPGNNGNNTKATTYPDGEGTTTNGISTASGQGVPAGTCSVGYQGPNASGVPYAPCAFACHMTNTELYIPNVTTKNGKTSVSYTQATNPQFTNDYYGIAKQAGLKLRLDDVQTAASQVINAMIDTEEASNQFSVGIYEFNQDVTPIYPIPSGGTQPSEADTDLATAAKTIQSTAAPLQANQNIGNTDFVASVNDMVSGKYSTASGLSQTTPVFGTGAAYRANASGTSSPAIGMSGDGLTAGNPIKYAIIVTDGMEDTSDYDNNTREEGEMTSYKAEQLSSASTLAVCKVLKNLNITVFVLYIDYNPLSDRFYQTSNSYSYPSKPYQQPNAYTKNDFTLIKSNVAGAVTTSNTKTYAESTSSSTGNYPSGLTAAQQQLPPDEIGLIGCASSPTDFYEVSQDTSVGTAMNAILNAALTSSIKLIQ